MLVSAVDVYRRSSAFRLQSRRRSRRSVWGRRGESMRRRSGLFTAGLFVLVCITAPLRAQTCDDGKECTGPGMCVSGTCVAGEPVPDGTACGNGGCGACLSGACTTPLDKL